MRIAAATLARLLRAQGFDDAAAAAATASSTVPLAPAGRVELRSIYAVRRAVQADAGRDEAAAQIQRVLDALDQHAGERVLLGQVSDDNRRYVVVLSEAGDAIVGVVVPPRGP